MEAATAVPSRLVKSGFTNRSSGHCGVVLIENGKEKSLPVPPGDEIFLSAEEQILTANAPKREKDNPFENGTLVLTTPARQLVNRRPIGDPSILGDVGQAEGVDADAAEAERIEREAKREAQAEAERKRTAEAQAQAESGETPRRARPPAKPEGQGAVPEPEPQPEETAAKPQPATTEGERAEGEEVATPEADQT